MHFSSFSQCVILFILHTFFPSNFSICGNFGEIMRTSAASQSCFSGNTSQNESCSLWESDSPTNELTLPLMWGNKWLLLKRAQTPLKLDVFSKILEWNSPTNRLVPFTSRIAIHNALLQHHLYVLCLFQQHRCCCAATGLHGQHIHIYTPSGFKFIGSVGSSRLCFCVCSLLACFCFCWFCCWRCQILRLDDENLTQEQFRLLYGVVGGARVYTRMYALRIFPTHFLAVSSIYIYRRVFICHLPFRVRGGIFFAWFFLGSHSKL